MVASHCGWRTHGLTDPAALLHGGDDHREGEDGPGVDLASRECAGMELGPFAPTLGDVSMLEPLLAERP